MWRYVANAVECNRMSHLLCDELCHKPEPVFTVSSLGTENFSDFRVLYSI